MKTAHLLLLAFSLICVQGCVNWVAMNRFITCSPRHETLDATDKDHSFVRLRAILDRVANENGLSNFTSQKKSLIAYSTDGGSIQIFASRDDMKNKFTIKIYEKPCDASPGQAETMWLSLYDGLARQFGESNVSKKRRLRLDLAICD